MALDSITPAAAMPPARAELLRLAEAIVPGVPANVARHFTGTGGFSRADG
jgi:hypothetical protein